MSESVIHRSVTDDGVVEITQDQHIRSLYFGNDAKQSSIDLSQPQRLVLSYTRAMMSCLIFNPEPQKVLMIGLGGGSLARFLLHHYPACLIDAVEIRRDVVKLAHGYFCLPEKTNLRIYQGDAAEFLINQDDQFSGYDLILVDAFNHDGVADSVKQSHFFSSCYDRMNNNGLLSVNLWKDQAEHCTNTIHSLERAFDNTLLELPVKDKGNLIMLAAKDKNSIQLSNIKQTARNLEEKLGVEFLSLLRQLKRANRWSRLGRLFF